ncbi:MAG TPA: DUF488 domain-containing protein [Desulfatiglandales bacterium]|nr:DUF488 domain-containing protein [Desulfatiglandales bacterium]
MNQALTIYTLGTGTRSEEEFLDLLRHYHIKTVVDVRSFPQSRFEHFKGENLQRILKEQEFNYIYLGKDLGGFRKGGYPAYMETAPYKESISHLEKIGKRSATAFICAERFPWKCHRRFIASSLGNRGWKIVHIIDKDKVWTPKPTK